MAFMTLQERLDEIQDLICQLDDETEHEFMEGELRTARDLVDTLIQKLRDFNEEEG